MTVNKHPKNLLANNCGRFLISNEVFTEWPGLVIRMQMELFITRLEYRFDCGAFEYSAFGPLFKHQPNFVEPPWYLLKWEGGNSGRLVAEPVAHPALSFPDRRDAPKIFRLIRPAEKIESVPTETTTNGTEES